MSIGSPRKSASGNSPKVTLTTSDEFMIMTKSEMRKVFEIAGALKEKKIFLVEEEGELEKSIILLPQKQTLVIRDFMQGMERSISLLSGEKPYVEYYVGDLNAKTYGDTLPGALLELLTAKDLADLQRAEWRDSRGLIFSFDEGMLRTHRMRNELDHSEAKGQFTDRKFLEEIWGVWKEARSILENLKSKGVIRNVGTNVGNLLEKNKSA